MVKARMLAFALAFFACTRFSSSSKVPALFVFGDSTVDTGNLKRSNVPPLVTSNSLPYGRDFEPPGPTGRASNGKLAIDFLAEYLELPPPPPSSGGRSSMLQGRNFAAGGSGFRNSTGQLLATIPFSEQVESFQRGLSQLAEAIQPEALNEFLAKSLFVVSTGNNDLFNFIFNPAIRLQYDGKSYNQFVLDAATSLLERLYQLGARKMVVLSVGPLGCTPAVLTMFNSDGNCIEQVNQQVKDFNRNFQARLPSRPDLQLVFVNAFDFLLQLVQNPSQKGFKYGKVACCGVGRFRASGCNSFTNVCSSADDYVFWDMVHPTQAVYKLVAEQIESGPPSVVSPVNVSQLVST